MGGIVQHGAGLVHQQFGIIFRIHGIGHLVVIITRVRHQGQHIAVVHIRHHDGPIAGLQRQLRRRNIQVADPVHHKIESRDRTVKQLLFLLRRNINGILLAENHADLSAAYYIVLDHESVNSLLKFQFTVQLFKNILTYSLIDLGGVRVLLFQI